MSVTPSAADQGLVLGLSFFLGLAFEDVFAHAGTTRPGGIRTFPMLALAGGMLYLLDRNRLVAFTGGLVLLGAWLLVFYREHIRERDEHGQPNVGLMVLLLNVHAYLLGAIALALPHWVAVGTTVVAVLLLTGRERLHELARRVEVKEIVTAGQFLILTGLILPLLPTVPVTSLTSITPRQAWLALVVVCSLSYVSYLAQRYLPVAARGLWMAALGGLYSSTATTVVLARQAKADAAMRSHARGGDHPCHRSHVCPHLGTRGGVQPDARAPPRDPATQPVRGCAADLRAPIPGSPVRAPRPGAPGGQPKSARARCGGDLRGPLRAHGLALDVGDGGIRDRRRVFPGGSYRGDGYRSLRAQPRAGGHVWSAWRRDRRRDLDRRLFQQPPEGGVCRLVWGARATAPSAAVLAALALGGIAMAIHVGGW